MSETQSAARCPGLIQQHCESMENLSETQDSDPFAVPPSPKPRHSLPRDTGEDTGNKPGGNEDKNEENNNTVNGEGEDRTPTNSPGKEKGGDEEENLDKSVDKNEDKVRDEGKNDLENKESRDKEEDESGNISDTRTPTPRPRSNLNNNANSNVDQNQKVPLANNPDDKSVGADPGKPGDKEDILLNADASQSDPDNTQTNLDREQDSKVPKDVQEKSLTKQGSKRDLNKGEPVSWEIDLSDKGVAGSPPVAGTGDQTTGSSKVSPAPSGGSKTSTPELKNRHLLPALQGGSDTPGPSVSQQPSRQASGRSYTSESVASVSDIMLGNMDFTALPLGRKSTPKHKATFSGQSTLVDRYTFILHTLKCQKL